MLKHIKYHANENVLRIQHNNLRKLIVSIAAGLILSAAFIAPVFAASNGNGVDRTEGIPTLTTLDACGYFIGMQTSQQAHIFTNSNDILHDNERGTWTGIDNNYYNTPIASLGRISGTYNESTSTSGNGVTSGSEEFQSSAGNISQIFTYGPGVPGGYEVSVHATGELAFLTSNTNGNCYSGQFPRP